ncbi:MAG: hypothetical protein ABIG60_02340 [Patescibacteria group bacterium]
MRKTLVIIVSVFLLFCFLPCFSIAGDIEVKIQDIMYADHNGVEHNIKIYGVPCPNEPTAIDESISDYILSNVQIIYKEEGMLYLGEVIGLFGDASYNRPDQSWKGYCATRIEIY